MNLINLMDEFPYKLTLFLLGCHILIRCKYRACLDGIAATFSPVIYTPWSTPDVVIDCNWEKADRYLFRTRPPEDAAPLFGVRVHTPGKLAESDWPFLEPPIPPFVVEPFRNRFIGLHAGSVQTHSGECLIFLGNQGSGKTTTTLALVNNHKCSLLTDETVFIHRRTKLVEPFPRSVHLREIHNGSLRKVSVPANQACRAVTDKPALATRIIFLEPDEKVQGREFSPLTPSESFKNFLKHHLNAGCCPDESMVTLTQLAREVPAFIYRYTTYEDLLSLPEKYLEIC